MSGALGSAFVVILNSFFKIGSKTDVEKIVLLAEENINTVWERHVHRCKVAVGDRNRLCEKGDLNGFFQRLNEEETALKQTKC